MHKLLLLLALLLLSTACAATPAAPAPSPVPTVAVAPGAPTTAPEPTAQAIPSASPIPTVAEAAPTPASAATAPIAAPPGPAHPAWIAINQVSDPVEGFSTASLVDADSGQVVANVCPTIGERELAWSFDGSWLACSFTFGLPTITLVSAADPSDKQKWQLGETSAYQAFLAWSPVEQALAVSSGAELYLIVPGAAAEPRLLKACAGYSCSAIAWSPDGLRLATNDEQGLSVLTVADGGEVSVADEGIYLSGSTPDTRDTATPLESVAWSPDGSQIAYTAQGGIYVVAAAGGEARRVIAAPYRGGDLSWSQDGRQIFFIGPDRQIESAAVDGSSQGYGQIVEQVPALRSQPPRCSASLSATGQAPVWIPGPDEPPTGPVYDLFVSFTQSEAVVQLTEGGIYGPLLLQAGEKMPAVSPFVVGAWAPGPVRAPTLALADPPLRGCAVLELQSRLEGRGFSPGAIDGIYGPNTAAAVRAFQQASGLATDGIVGPQTWAGLGGWSWGS